MHDQEVMVSFGNHKDGDVKWKVNVTVMWIQNMYQQFVVDKVPESMVEGAI